MTICSSNGKENINAIDCYTYSVHNKYCPSNIEKGGMMSLYENINKRKKAGTSRPKSKSTVSKKAYANMKKGFPTSKKKKGKKSDA